MHFVTPSMITTYFTCPRAFYYQYVKRIQPPPSRAMQRGSLIHTILAHTPRIGPPYTRERLLTAYTRLLTHSLNHEYRDFKDEADTLHTQLAKAADILAHLPQPRSVKAEVMLEDDEHGLRGKIDLILHTREETLLLEWKTGRIRTGFMTPHTLQADAYLLLTRHYAERRVMLISLKTGEKGEWRETPYTRIRIQKILARIQPILTGSIIPEKKHSIACHTCPYASRCWGTQPES